MLQLKKMRDFVRDLYNLDDKNGDYHNIVDNDGLSLDNGISIVKFNTYHGDTTSCGWLIQRLERTIKPEHRYKSGEEKEKLDSEGTLYEEKLVNKIAITGDTTYNVFLDSSNDFLEDVQILITDMTFLDKGTSTYEAEIKGHLHIDQLSGIPNFGAKFLDTKSTLSPGAVTITAG